MFPYDPIVAYVLNITDTGYIQSSGYFMVKELNAADLSGLLLLR